MSLREKIVSCPFNRVHRVEEKKLQHHIIKCMVNYPNHVQCTYSALHWFETKEKMLEHAKDCPSQLLVVQHWGNTNNSVCRDNNSEHNSRKFHLQEENWDSEYL